MRAELGSAGIRAAGRWTGQWLRGRGRRMRRLRRDDEAQVMVLVAIMVFMVALFTLSTGNISRLLYKRVRAQTAVDAAADAYALWQARSFNLEQHGNDLLFDAHLAWMVQHLLVCLERYNCPNNWCTDVDCVWIPFVGDVCIDWDAPYNCASAVKNCCRDINNQLADIERQQASFTETMQIMQAGVNSFGPVIGWLEANAVAAANGADPLLDGPLETALENIFDTVAPGADLDAIIAALKAIPGAGDVYALPMNPLAAIDLGLRRQGESVMPMFPFPPYQVGGPCFVMLTSLVGLPDATGESINDIWCLLSDCGGFLPISVHSRGGVSPLPSLNPPRLGKIASMLANGGYEGCDYDCVRATTDFPQTYQKCGWSTPFYWGIPQDNTWIAGREGGNISPILQNMPWMNPTFAGDPDVAISYSQSDDFAFTTGPAKTTEFMNPPFVVMSTSRAFGSPILLQPVMPLPSWLIPGFGYSRPQLASVNILGIDAPEEAIFIYH